MPLEAKAGTLSGGQRTRVAFALAFGKHPDPLVLDEPMADLDPLVRRELMSTLTAEAAEHGTTVLVSSHMLAELEHICDQLLVVANDGLRLAGEVHELRAAHALLDVPGGGPSPAVTPHQVIESRRGEGRPGVLVPSSSPSSSSGAASACCDVPGREEARARLAPAARPRFRSVSATRAHSHSPAARSTPPGALVRGMAAGQASLLG
ncbi:ATP-binding cassette domain-containing protein [Streptomyces sp. NPDC004980]